MAVLDSPENLDHPSLRLADTDPSPPLPVSDHGVQTRRKELEDEDGVFVLAPEVLEEGDDVGGVAERLEGLDLAEAALVVVDLLQGDGEVVGSPAGAVDVGVSAGPDPVQDLVAVGDLFAPVDAPAAPRFGG